MVNDIVKMRLANIAKMNNVKKKDKKDKSLASEIH